MSLILFLICSSDCDDKTWASMDRILKIWEQRSIYDTGKLLAFKQAIGQRRVDSSLAKGASSSGHSSSSHKQVASKSASRSSDKGSTSGRRPSDTSGPAEKKLKTVPAEIPKHRMPDLPEAKEGLIVEPDSLMKALKGLETSASKDSEMRERIAKFPPEVTDVRSAERILKSGDSIRLMRLQSLVEEACILLSDYNHKLSQEMDDRKRIAILLATFIKNQKDRLDVTAASIKEYNEKLVSVANVRKKLKDHYQNLPDLSLLPSVMEPLPSATDLFNLHNVHAIDVRAVRKAMDSTATESPDPSNSSASPATSGYSPALSSSSPVEHDFPTPKS